MAFYDLMQFKDKIAFKTEHQEIEYTEIQSIAQKMLEKIEPRSLVLQLCTNSLGSAVGYLAFLYNKVVPILVDQSIDGTLSQQLINSYQPSYLYVPTVTVDKFKYDAILFEFHDYSLLKINQRTVYSLHPELALLLTTSGSTGSRKLVRLSYTNIQSNAQSIAQYLELDATHRPITCLPMNYTYGLSVINSHVLVGATVLLTSSSLLESEFWRVFKKYQATSIAGVPYTYQILKKLQFGRMNLPSLSMMTQAGGRLSLSLQEEFAAYAQKSGIKFIIMYGQTEATARMSYLPYQQLREKIGSIGIPIPGGCFNLCSPEGEEIDEPNKIGELVYYGANVSMGYAESYLDLVNGDLLQGRLKTGDMAMKDEDNYYYLVGRLNRFLKIFGIRVNLDEVEQLLHEHFTSFSFACIGIDDLMRVFTTCNNETQLKEIKRYLNKKTGINNFGVLIKSITEIPKNEAGKIKYSDLDQM
jgi:acyl-CoA synthetase (AMP-forming)/AMP-acid ligase II